MKEIYVNQWYINIFIDILKCSIYNSLLDSGLLSIFFNKDSSYNINPNLKNYLKDSRYPKNFSYAFHLFLIVFEFKYDLNEEDKQYLIEFVPIKYNNNLSYSPKEENQFKKRFNTTNS